MEPKVVHIASQSTSKVTTFTYVGDCVGFVVDGLIDGTVGLGDFVGC